MIILDLIISACLGFFLHQSKVYTARLPRGWQDLTEHSVGVIGASPAFVLWWIRLKGIGNPLNRAVLAYALAFMGVGSGVMAGWLYDTFKDDLPR